MEVNPTYPNVPVLMEAHLPDKVDIMADIKATADIRANEENRRSQAEQNHVFLY